MLQALNVKNFAIIDNVSVEFKDGMTVLTGETGAGKSLIIDAIGLLLGKRANVDMIRSGEERAIIEGVFSPITLELASILADVGIEYDLDDCLVIKREININGKSIARINGSVVNLSVLAIVGELLGDIHSSDDVIGLINPKYYLSFITNDSINSLLVEYKDAYSNYRDLLKEYNELVAKNSDAKAKEDFLLFSIHEFDQAKLRANEEEELKNEVNVLKNAETIVEYIKEINDVYNGTSLDEIRKAIVSLEKLSKYDEKYAKLLDSLNDSYYNIDAILSDDAFKFSRVSFDEKRLDYINERLSLYSSLKRKYNKDTASLLKYYDEMKAELELSQNYDYYVSKAKDKLDFAKNNAIDLARKLHIQRKEFAEILENVVLENLLDLQLKNSIFKIEFKEMDLSPSGIDDIDFLVSFNKGEELKPLSKVASGGELSRFMLALKTALSKALPQQVKIFDEVDHGVSGSVAHSIGQKIHSISERSQVLCITHLPQVAAIADTHLFISKMVENDRTVSLVTELDNESRVVEIAKMMGDGDVSEETLAASRKLLNK